MKKNSSEIGRTPLAGTTPLVALSLIVFVGCGPEVSVENNPVEPGSAPSTPCPTYTPPVAAGIGAAELEEYFYLLCGEGKKGGKCFSKKGQDACAECLMQDFLDWSAE